MTVPSPLRNRASISAAVSSGVRDQHEGVEEGAGRAFREVPGGRRGRQAGTRIARGPHAVRRVAVHQSLDDDRHAVARGDDRRDVGRLDAWHAVDRDGRAPVGGCGVGAQDRPAAGQEELDVDDRIRGLGVEDQVEQLELGGGSLGQVPARRAAARGRVPCGCRNASPRPRSSSVRTRSARRTRSAPRTSPAPRRADRGRGSSRGRGRR